MSAPVVAHGRPERIKDVRSASARSSRFATLKLIEETKFGPEPANAEEEDDEDD